MSRTAVTFLTLTAVSAASLSAVVAGYQLQLVESAGVKLTSNVPVNPRPRVYAAGVPNAVAMTCRIDVPGSYAASVICVDAAGNTVTHSDGSPLVIPGPTDPIIVTDEPVTVMVSIPLSFEIELV